MTHDHVVSVATAIANVFQNNEISMRRNLAKIMELAWEGI
jgi:hypothetical protein